MKTAIDSMGVESFDERMARWFGAMSAQECREWLIGASSASTTGQAYMQPAPGNSALRSILFFDQVSWLPDNLLERGDRMTMAASLEARMPFMDHKLAEFVSTLPDSYRVRRGRTKYVLRQAMRQLLPDRILERPKVGFRVPVNEWFRGSMRDYLTDMLTARQSQTSALVNQAKVSLALQEHVEGRCNHEKLLWALLGLEIWAQCTLPPAAPQVIRH
jgi:asparagine synthase (glutamine-hydrolysing)